MSDRTPEQVMAEALRREGRTHSLSGPMGDCPRCGDGPCQQAAGPCPRYPDAEPVFPDPVQEGQDFSRWFTLWPSTHRLHPQTVEVIAVERLSRGGWVQLTDEERKVLRDMLAGDRYPTLSASTALYDKLAPLQREDTG